MYPAEGATVIGPSSKVTGEIEGSEDLLVEGEVEGSITLPGGKVTIGSHGRVRARIFAQEIVVSGRVHGDLLATGSIQLRGSAMVLGNIVSPRFMVDEEALIRGHVEPSSALDPRHARPAFAPVPAADWSAVADADIRADSEDAVGDSPSSLF